MQIISLKLKNIKSYGADGTAIQFAPGLNLIKGNNGAGKSTVLEAIGYVLFDSEPYRPIQNFVRMGQKNGEIVVTVLSSYDGREYQIVRGVGKPLYYVYDPELKDKATSAADDTRDWLRQHLGIDPDIDLKALFHDAVGVPQGTMTAIFLESPGERQKKFDTLLQVEEYKTAFNNLLASVKYVEKLQRQNETETSRLSGQLERLPEVNTGIGEIEHELKQNRAEVETLKEQLDGLGAMLDHMDAQRRAIDDLKSQVATQENKIEIAKTKLVHAKGAVEESRHAVEGVEQTAEAHEQFHLAGQDLQTLETRQKERDRWQKKRNNVDKERIREQAQLDQLYRQLQEIAQAEADMIRLEPLANQQRELETALHDAQAKFQRYEQLTEDLARAESDLDGLQVELERLGADVAHRGEIEGQIAERKRERDALKSEIERIAEEIAPLDAEYSRLKAAWAEQIKRDEERERLLKHIGEIDEALQEKHAEWDSIQLEIARRLELKTELENLEQQQAAVQKSELEAQATIERADHQIQEIERFRQITDAAETVCPICQRPLDAEARANSLTHYADEAWRIDAERTQAESVLSESKRAQKTLAKSIKAARAEQDSLPTDLVASRIGDEIVRHERDLQTQTQKLAALSDAPEQLERLTVDLEAVEGQRRELNAQKQALETRRQVCSEAIEADQKALGELARPVELEQKQAEYSVLAEETANNQEEAAALADSDRRCDELRMALDPLGDPRRDYEKASDRAGTREQFERERDDHQGKMVELDRQIAEYDSTLAEYAFLDQEMQEARVRQESSRDAHELYIQHKPLAEKLPERERLQGRLEAEQAELQQTLDELEHRHEDHMAGYEAQQHADMQQSHQEKQGRLNHLTGQMEGKEQNHRKLRADRDALLDIQGKCQELKAEADQFQAENEALEFVRNTIRDAGPQITKQLIRLIAAEANQIFGEIIGDYSLTLDWQEDYGIVIIQHGKVDEPREFKQLSGGEQMAAALSVRLALLARLSNIRFAFFDEPTSNLDGTRRTQLAERLNAIRSLHQVFVISHDDTFEEASQHVIHIQKTDDSSQVEVL